MVRELEYVIFGILTAANLLLGLYYSVRKAASLPGAAATKAEVFLGSRTLRVLPLAVSSVASLYSSTGLVGFPAHYYAYGWHIMWCNMTLIALFPLATYMFVPLFYNLGVTSIFQQMSWEAELKPERLGWERYKNNATALFLKYLRMRFNRTISLTACAIYIFLTQSVAAISVFAASLVLVKVFNAPLLWSNIAIGLSGAIYTSLGGLRGVVCTDCMQFIVMLIAPTAFVAKVMVDSFSATSTVQPMGDFNIREYIGNFRLDFTADENVSSWFLGSSAIALYRMCLDQMVVQRFLASRTLKEAQRTAITTCLLLIVAYIMCFSMGAALTIWFRGCDPGLLGAIRSIDQIIPYYLKTEFIKIPGIVGLFTAGVVCAATSTVSSTINSQATLLYVDVISHWYRNADEHVLLITRCVALILGIILTIYSTVVVYMGSLTRILFMVNSAITAPFVGLCLIATLFPFVHCKGAGVSTLLIVVYQMWHIADIITSGRQPPRTPVSLDYCPGNISATLPAVNVTLAEARTRSQGTVFIFRLSHMWSSFFSIFATIIFAVLISALTGEIRHKKMQKELCSDLLMRTWRKLKRSSVRHQPANAEQIHSDEMCEGPDAEFATLMMETKSTSA